MDQRILQIIQKHPELKPEFEEIYPELKDSEDERMRKDIIQFFKDAANSKTRVVYSNTFAEWVTYLEKQKDVLGERAKNITANMLEDGVEGIQRELIEFLSNTIDASWVNIIRSADTYAERIRNIIEKQKEQKPAEWSEEDETCLECVLWCVMKTRRFVAKDACDLDACQRAERWLKSLCPQPKAEWSEKDDAAHTRVIGALAKAFRGILPTKPLEEDIEWFKSLPKRFNLQPKQEWSEEDEYVIDKVIEWAKIVNPTSTIFEKIPKEQFIKRLKSLHPQPEKNWKRYIWNVNMRFDYGALVKYDDHYGFEIVTSGGKPKREVNGEYIFLKDICSTSY